MSKGAAATRHNPETPFLSLLIHSLFASVQPRRREPTSWSCGMQCCQMRETKTGEKTTKLQSGAEASCWQVWREASHQPVRWEPSHWLPGTRNQKQQNQLPAKQLLGSTIAVGNRITPPCSHPQAALPWETYQLIYSEEQTTTDSGPPPETDCLEGQEIPSPERQTSTIHYSSLHQVPFLVSKGFFSSPKTCSSKQPKRCPPPLPPSTARFPAWSC